MGTQARVKTTEALMKQKGGRTLTNKVSRCCRKTEVVARRQMDTGNFEAVGPFILTVDVHGNLEEN